MIYYGIYGSQAAAVAKKSDISIDYNKHEVDYGY